LAGLAPFEGPLGHNTTGSTGSVIVEPAHTGRRPAGAGAARGGFGATWMSRSNATPARLIYRRIGARALYASAPQQAVSFSLIANFAPKIIT